MRTLNLRDQRTGPTSTEHFLVSTSFPGEWGRGLLAELAEFSVIKITLSINHQGDDEIQKFTDNLLSD